MSGGHGAAIPPEAVRSLPSQVSKIAQGLLITVGVASTGISIAGEWQHGHGLLNQWLLGNVASLGAILNLLLILLVLFPGRVQDINEDVESPTVRHAARCINAFCLPAWTWFWVFLGLFYVALLFCTSLGDYEHLPVRFDESLVTSSYAMLDLLSAGSTICIYLAYLFLTPSFLRHYTNESKRRVTLRWAQTREFWIAAAAFVPVGILVVALRLFMLRTPDPTSIDRGLSAALGLASAIALGHFVGRMDSKFIQNWQWIVPVLFLYAGIQVYSAVLYEAAPINRAAFVYGAFTMKCVLFVFVSDFFESRRVLYYAVELIEGENKDL